MQHLTSNETYQWYQRTHRLKTIQTMEEQSEQRKSIQQESKQHGIMIGQSDEVISLKLLLSTMK